ncbi:hypothetical protein C8F04DRAFT_537027 [Mycena alexandri]|uniref:Uncharacterized protein n=1 Tax=Mycena alexandri TaxID=1745969 RepID=A0AAD6SWH8_9AGAR|nr:hypothetical protein C8F04DRAFT_537027 [Mycena alexandri]
MAHCQFCEVSTTNGFNIIWENELFVAFWDRKPAAELHIQLVPRQHIGMFMNLRINTRPMSSESSRKRQIVEEKRRRAWFVIRIYLRAVAVLSLNCSQVRSMKAIGEKLLDDLGSPPSMRVLGFHIPPFNSVNHLHLHVQGLPYKPLRQAKYRISSGFAHFNKGFGWFVEAEQAARSLETGRTIGVFPC